MMTTASLSTLRDAATAAQVRLANVRTDGKGRTRFVLKIGETKRWYRANGRGRRIGAVCWHGHYVFLAELFMREPHATVTAGCVSLSNPGPFGIVYDGLPGFLAKADDTYDTPRCIGGKTHAYGSLCYCDVDTDDGRMFRAVWNRARSKGAIHE